MLNYQKESHHGKLDTIGKKGRKEVLEAQMDQVEADIKKLQKNYIFIDTTAPSTMFWASRFPSPTNKRIRLWLTRIHNAHMTEWLTKRTVVQEQHTRSKDSGAGSKIGFNAIQKLFSQLNFVGWVPYLDHSAQADGGAISGVKACTETTWRCSSDNAARAERDKCVLNACTGAQPIFYTLL